MKFLTAALGALLLAGCASAPPRQVTNDDDNVPMQRMVSRGVSGGVFTGDTVSLTSDSRAYRVGDAVTVILQETTQASKRAGTSFSKGSSASVAPIGALGKTFGKTGIEIAADRNFEGDATSTQQNALSGALTVIVQEVLPNGLLRVAGEKNLMLNQGEEFVRLKGFIRAQDIDNDNQVSSLRVANARIAYSGKGALADANQPGWLTRFFNSPLMPF
ncbi:flagellar basal body L-ring protein FlgH [Massilia sp. IC2-477]|uniref:flagellar basal body L-ring protein FlgH n=1 Tax=unclassified Massilia TaxID=2609279 RepID=UPI001D103A00|nr:MULTISPECIES: flagellar basal body L-ring protein FlgH [unclassified Massilia]MCC2954304.1 flagellar basal body L-ring protein FlgH [Massilia sp. IC2-477]MCC2971743.1 flagellar basal body L-ring protein FlgH [Massilia sp. IC2-476]